jgi:hypothetical protein
VLAVARQQVLLAGNKRYYRPVAKGKRRAAPGPPEGQSLPCASGSVSGGG